MESKNSKKPIFTIVKPTTSVEDLYQTLLNNLQKQGIEVKSSAESEISRGLKKELKGEALEK